jgi:hypothetical protein
MGDTITNAIIPVSTDSRPYPISGTVVRSMRVTLTYAGESPTTFTRREVVTYDGSDTATVVIMQVTVLACGGSTAIPSTSAHLLSDQSEYCLAQKSHSPIESRGAPTAPPNPPATWGHSRGSTE